MGTIDTSTTIKAATDSITNITATLANYMQEDLGRGSISWDYFCNNPDWTAYGVLAGFSILMGIIVVVLLVFIWGVAKHVSIRFRDISLKWCGNVYRSIHFSSYECPNGNTLCIQDISL